MPDPELKAPEEKPTTPAAPESKPDTDLVSAVSRRVSDIERKLSEREDLELEPDAPAKEETSIVVVASVIGTLIAAAIIGLVRLVLHLRSKGSDQ